MPAQEGLDITLKKILAKVRLAAQPCFESIRRAAVSDELRRLKASEHRLSQDLAERDAQMTSQAKILAKVRAESNAAKQECVQLTVDRDEARRQVEDMTAELRELEESAAAMKIENVMLQEEAGQLRHELTKMATKMGSPGLSMVPPTPDRASLRKSQTTPDASRTPL